MKKLQGIILSIILVGSLVIGVISYQTSYSSSDPIYVSFGFIQKMERSGFTYLSFRKEKVRFHYFINNSPNVIVVIVDFHDGNYDAVIIKSKKREISLEQFLHSEFPDVFIQTSNIKQEDIEFINNMIGGNSVNSSRV